MDPNIKRDAIESPYNEEVIQMFMKAYKAFKGKERARSGMRNSNDKKMPLAVLLFF